jgi:hypothetical protein
MPFSLRPHPIGGLHRLFDFLEDANVLARLLPKLGELADVRVLGTQEGAGSSPVAPLFAPITSFRGDADHGSVSRNSRASEPRNPRPSSR